MFPKWSDWHIKYTRKGLIKHRISRAARVAVLIATIVGAYYIRKDVRGGLRAIVDLSQQFLRSALLGVQEMAQRGISVLSV